MPGVTFNKINICNISGLDLGWGPVTLNCMSDFVLYYLEHSCELGLNDLDVWSNKLYGKKATEDDTTKNRILSYFRCAKSIYESGYVTFLDRPWYFTKNRDRKDMWLFMNKFDTVPHEFLPRVREQSDLLTIDDGRHRLAVLNALGVKKTPVVEVSVLPPGTREHDWKVMVSFGKRLLIELDKFKCSKEWKSYKDTDCYKKVAPRI